MATFPISTSRESLTDGEALSGLYIPDGEGNPRWVWPAASNKPVFLRFVQPVNWKQRGFVSVVQLVFLLRLQRLVFKSMPLGPDYNLNGTDWAVFTGTPGPNRKRVVMDSEGTITKEASTEMAVANLTNEAFFLQQLQTLCPSPSFIVPRIVQNGTNALTMERIANRGTWSHFNGQHTKALAELRQVSCTTGPVGSWGEWENIYERINQLRNARHPEIPSHLVDALLHLVLTEDMQPVASFGIAHGDFTPWNTLRTPNDRLGIIDWELARTELPLGFDFFHFHLQNGVMVERKTWAEIYHQMQQKLTPETRTAIFGTATADVDQYLRLYLAHHVSYYLSVYQKQEEWHQQIYWQLDVWSDAIMALAPPSDQRKALIGRLFALLNNKKYAVLKMDNDDPQELPADSDLDILIRKEEAHELINRLKAFSGLAQCRVMQKSFMMSVFLVLEDGGILNLDLIWVFKWKSVSFMEVNEVIRNACLSSYGIRVVSPRDTRQYLRFFYGLNGATVPAKFGLGQDHSSLPPVLTQNSGLRGWGNRLNYLLDTARTMIFNRGYVVTFSGVDGAGKSTVIEHVTKLLDKQFRRPVKVLRHRPSVLPILSALRYGKEEAERKSVATLPRTGTNTSRLSSLARFSYYYLDYLLGQWYVQLRYVLRGYVVVYDRYYYDFMIDGRRSNLELPFWITATGFRLIRKPEFNFFLFADADTILARKQELAKDTIVSLTQRYKALFERLGKGRTSSVFTSIENVELADTLRVIREALLKKTA
ncbi:phosphotransferase [Neolewinella aurantiaca]|uniref:Phosphotransferase n=1 Tax=Neolewinella aurantiaca TaxID=2602767 RepID=A0A5C7FMH6_9BACT|nr:phosphotransferase [Neolewinella aurantiaca]TXF85965.1 phosphotransferase [Neolewinella aurantiaca]